MALKFTVRTVMGCYILGFLVSELALIQQNAIYQCPGISNPTHPHTDQLVESNKSTCLFWFVQANWSHFSVMRGEEVFCAVVSEFFGSLAPKHESNKNTCQLLWTVFVLLCHWRSLRHMSCLSGSGLLAGGGPDVLECCAVGKHLEHCETVLLLQLQWPRPLHCSK